MKKIDVLGKDYSSLNDKKLFLFDMDGTIAYLYGVYNWLDMLRNYDPTPYANAKPMWDME